MHSPRLAAFATLGLMIGLTALCPAASAAGIAVPLDEVRVITFKYPVKTVFIGNPVIADVTVIDPQHVFVLGKSFGTTNLVALDDEGNQRVNEHVSVFGRTGEAVTLHRGAAQTTLTCTPSQCVAAPTPGDDNTAFDAVTGQIEKHQAQNTKAGSN
jgi:Flp pilus assembly secretin CpaC